MHIAIAIEKLKLDGGAERSTRQTASLLRSRGHRVTLLAGDLDEEAVPADVDAVELPGSTGAMGMAWMHRSLEKHWSKLSPDVTVSMTTNLPAQVVIPRAGLVPDFQQQRVDRIETALGRAGKQLAIALNPKQQVMRQLERRTLFHPSLRRVVAISGLMKQRLLEQYGLSDDRVTHLPNGAAPPSPPDRPEDQPEAMRSAMRRALQLEAQHTVFLFPALDPWRKGLDSLVQAFAQLLQHAPPPSARLLLVGNSSYRLQDMLAKAGVRNVTRVLGATERMDAVFAAADVTVLPTWYDPSSKVVMESLMRGRPVITTRTNGASEFVDPVPDALPPGVPRPSAPRGRVIDSPRDLEGLTQAMRELCEMEHRSLCEAQCMDLHDALSMERHVDQLETLLTKVVSDQEGSD